MRGGPGPKLLYVTDLHYESRGRVYYREDLDLSRRLAPHFALVLCDPRVARSYLGDVDGVLFRSTGPVAEFAEEYRAFREAALAAGTRVFNELTGRADMAGKEYLVELWNAGFPVIPTVDRPEALERLPQASRYVLKPKDGADSAGLEIVAPALLAELEIGHRVVQPRIDFEYEVSFYFLNDVFHYALYAPDPAERWRLEPYGASPRDLDFARRFIDWNEIDFGIQRVDAVRTKEGELLLMELEDINPYLSLDLLPDAARRHFVGELQRVLLEYLSA